MQDARWKTPAVAVSELSIMHSICVRLKFGFDNICFWLQDPSKFAAVAAPVAAAAAAPAAAAKKEEKKEESEEEDDDMGFGLFD